MRNDSLPRRPAEERLRGAKRIAHRDVARLLNHVFEFPPTNSNRRRNFLFAGDTRLDGPFELDAYEVVIVTGDLDVDGPLIDFIYGKDRWSALYVFGDLRCEQLVSGSTISVRGNVEVRNLAYLCRSGRDTLNVGGMLQARVLVDDDHRIAAMSIEAPRVLTNEFTIDHYGDELPLDILAAEHFVDPSLFRHGVVDAVRLHDAITRGLPIIKDAR